MYTISEGSYIIFIPSQGEQLTPGESTMKALIKRIIVVPKARLGESRSIPAEVSLASPILPVHPPRPREFPQGMTNAAGLKPFTTEPSNDATLVLGHPRGLRSQGSEG